ncbi:MAG: response regulator transcription factor [Ardenticatenaceae bacterium]
MPSNLPILIVDDQSQLLLSIQMTLEAYGFDVLTANDGLEGLEILQSKPVGLILADIAMPRMNGYQLFERVRENPDWLGIPFIFLTARSLDSDIRFGKEMGVDDYLIKPIEPEDLVAAVRGKLKRAEQLRQHSAHKQAYENAASQMTPPTSLKVGALEIDTNQHRAWVRDEALNLSAKEFKLLTYLAQNQEKVVSPPQLVRVTHEFETDYIEASNLLRPLIRSLRRKLGYMVGEMGCIENVRGVGYRLVAIPD